MSEFVSREEFDALLERVVALENGTTSGVVVKASAPRTRGTRLHPDWLPYQITIDKMAQELVVNEATLGREHGRFVDYYVAAPGQKGVKLDWDRTWCNWMRNAAERGQLGRGTAKSVGDKVQGWMELGDGES